jgi:hypothetical protein
MTISIQLSGTTVDGRITGSSMGFTGRLTGTFDGQQLTAEVQVNVPDVPSPIRINAQLDGEDRFSGTISVAEMAFAIEGQRVSKQPTEFRVERSRRRTRGKDGRPLPPKVNPAMEPLRQMLEKKIPAVVNVTTAAQIREVLDFLVDKHELAVTLLNAEDAAPHVKRLRDKKIPLIVPPQLVSTRRYREHLQADELARGGITIALQSNAEDAARHLPSVVLQAVERGLDADQALAALTLGAAQALKIEKRVGSIEPGKDADFVIFDGHPFKDAGKVRHVVVDGKEVLP